MRADLRLGDCLDVMRGMADNSVDAVVTDPPYGLSFMGKKWDYDVPGVDVWAEAFRVLKPGGHLLAFFGSRTYHRGVCRVEDAGFEIRDQIMWIYGSGFPKSHNLDGDWKGFGTALKPAHEPVVVARKPLDGTVAANVMEWGTGALNLDGCRVGTPQLSRFPANVIHDGSEEVLKGFPESKSTGGQASLGAFRNGDVYGRGRDEKEKRNPGLGDSGSAARFFYCAKASKADRDEGCEGLEEKQYSHDGREKPIENAYQRNNSVAKNNHPTVKPTDLMRYLCRLVTPPNGTVLDPFMGSGTTGKAAVLEGFGFIGIEREPEYFKIASARIAAAQRDKQETLL